ncbi:serine hydrolase domain-containing protein [Litorihabitans aurantiacus]|uniref:Serine hydrolase n=1 Tax=Litorihabitans aurantiacus TaxID=1930061 RepID=A0AA37XH70_9MICO|nr:serine hydrolase domain-containing protein [Litorihabitans aurantiacus]GMA32854.1 serine hydrolase [Litorihabitans aurantiacus]
MTSPTDTTDLPPPAGAPDAATDTTDPLTDELREALREAEDEPSAGVVRIDEGGRTLLTRAWGLADRRHAVAMTPEHTIAVASGAKGFTALTVMSLVADGTLTLATPARQLLGDDLPLVDDAVTIEHLLAHRAGIGDYLDDDADTAEYLLPGAMSGYVDPEDYLEVLGGHAQEFAPGTDFAYCNGGYVLLAILAQRASGTPFHELVRTRVIEPAGLTGTAYLRSDALPANAAVGYVEVDGEWRTNVHHLPVVGGGDGGIWTTAADLVTFWDALLAGRIVPRELVEEMLRERTAETDDELAYGLGFYLPEPGVVQLIGQDAGASFSSRHTIATARTASVLTTTADAAWDVESAIR